MGDAGNDEVYGVAGNDTILGGSGNDNLNGDAGDDTIYGGTGDDDIVGGSGEDNLYGEAGNDTITAASGHHPSDWDDDYILCDSGSSEDSTYSDNVVYRHAGYDTVLYCSNDSITNDES